MAELDRAGISLRLGQSREQAGLTQPELGDLLGVHWRTVQNYESPSVDRIPWGRLDEWARATGVTRDWLLHGEDGAREAEGWRLVLEAVAEQREALRLLLVELLERLPQAKPDTRPKP